MLEPTLNPGTHIISIWIDTYKLLNADFQTLVLQTRNSSRKLQIQLDNLRVELNFTAENLQNQITIDLPVILNTTGYESKR